MKTILHFVRLRMMKIERELAAQETERMEGLTENLLAAQTTAPSVSPWIHLYQWDNFRGSFIDR